MKGIYRILFAKLDDSENNFAKSLFNMLEEGMKEVNKESTVRFVEDISSFNEETFDVILLAAQKVSTEILNHAEGMLGEVKVPVLLVYDEGTFNPREVKLHIKEAVRSNKLNPYAFSLLLRYCVKGANLSDATNTGDRPDFTTNGLMQNEQDFLINLINSIKNGMIVIDRDFSVIFSNSTIRRWQKDNNYIGFNKCYQLLKGADSECDDCPAKAIFDSGEAKNYDRQFENINGEKFFFHVNAFPVKDSSGYVTHIIEIFEDVSQSKESELELKKLASAVEQSYNSIVITDTDGKIEYANNMAVESTGYTIDELIGENPRVLKSGKQPDSFYKELWETITQGNEWTGQFGNLRKNGELYWENAHISPVKNSEGEIKNFIAVKEDITERKAAEEALKRSEDMYRKVVDTSPYTIIINDRKGIITYASKKSTDLLGVRDELDVVGTDVRDWIAKEDHDRVEKDLQNVFESKGLVSPMEYIVTQSNGNRIFAEINSTIITDKDSKSEAMLSIIRDISTHKKYAMKLEEELMKKKKDIKSAKLLQRRLNTIDLPVVRELDLQAMYMPSDDLGGDFFHMSKSESGLLAIIIADCTGHGIEASLDATLLRAICDKYIDELEAGKPGFFLSSINNDLFNYYYEGKYPTMLAMTIDSSNFKVKYANANASLPYLIRRGEFAVMLENVNGLHLGFEEDATYSDGEFFLEEEDSLFFCSDALFEIFDRVHGKYLIEMGDIEDALIHSSTNSSAVLDSILEMLAKNKIKTPIEDDLTMLSVKRRGGWFQQSEHADKESAQNERLVIEEMLREYGYSKQVAANIGVTFHELVVNAFDHGNKNDPEKKVYTAVRIECEKTQISIRDEGEGFDPGTLNDPTDFDKLQSTIDRNEEKVFSHGRGVWLSKLYTDELRYNDTGNHVWFEKNRPSSRTVFG